METSVMGVTKMGNIVSRAESEPTSLTFQTITPHRLLDVTTITMPTFLCSSLPQRSMQTITLSYQSEPTAGKNQ